MEKLVRQVRRAQEAEELSREARQQATRKISYFFDHDGSLVLKGRLPAEMGEQLIKARHARQGPPINENTAATRWRGERMDYDLAIDVLLQKSRCRQGVSAETPKPNGRTTK